VPCALFYFSKSCKVVFFNNIMYNKGTHKIVQKL